MRWTLSPVNGRPVPVVPVSFQATRNQAILRLDSTETALCQSGLVVSALQAETPLPVDLLSASLDLVEGSVPTRHATPLTPTLTLPNSANS
jgi:hypothetical protein